MVRGLETDGYVNIDPHGDSLPSCQPVQQVTLPPPFQQDFSESIDPAEILSDSASEPRMLSEDKNPMCWEGSAEGAQFKTKREANGDTGQG